MSGDDWGRDDLVPDAPSCACRADGARATEGEATMDDAEREWEEIRLGIARDLLREHEAVDDAAQRFCQGEDITGLDASRLLGLVQFGAMTLLRMAQGEDV